MQVLRVSRSGLQIRETVFDSQGYIMSSVLDSVQLLYSLEYGLHKLQPTKAYRQGLN